MEEMETLDAYSRMTIKQGSKSFAKAALLFDPKTRQSVMMLYAWCRYCDDVIDGQTLGHGQQQLSMADKLNRLRMLEHETERICNGKSSQLSAFAALQKVIQRHGIEKRHLFELLEGFRLDAIEARFHTLNDTLHYCYHVAGVVGVMMARIMGVQEQEVIYRAADLGIAFQLSNIARDVRADLEVGRCYLPEEWLEEKHIARQELAYETHQHVLHALASRLVEYAEPYYGSARIGLAQLPWRCAWAIASALKIYRQIGLQVRTAGSQAWDGRVQVSDAKKLLFLCQGGLAASVAVCRRKQARLQRRSGLWTKPQSAGPV
jgi:phytoene synthase